MFQFNCPHCGYAMSSEPSRVGQNSYCPGCSQPFSIPAPPTKAPQNETPKHAEASGAMVKWRLFGVKAKAVCAALWREVRRITTLSVLKLRLRRLNSRDLKAAHYAFGKKCYELSLQKEKFATEFTAIGELQKQIADKRAGKASAAQESSTQKAKRVFGNLAGKAEAFFFARRLKKKLIAFGRVAAAADGSTDGAQAELERVKLVKRQIAKSEEAHGALSKNSTGSPIHPARYWAVVVAAVLLIVVGARFAFPPKPKNRYTSSVAIDGQSTAAQEDGKAAYMVAQKYRDGDGVAKDNGKALEFLQKAASQGDPKAQYRLGYAYLNGFDVPKDYAKAFKWFKKAADQENLDALNHLGLMYCEGHFVPQDKYKAIELWRQAAIQGHFIAQGNLAFLYESGDGVPKNYIMAYAWYNVVVTKNEPRKCVTERGRLEFLQNRMNRAEIAKAVELSEDFIRRGEIGRAIDNELRRMPKK